MEIVTSKTTIKTFEHLNEPILLSMPAGEVYSTKDEEGSMVTVEKRFSKPQKMKFEQAGRIFLIYDWETQSVYDWIFYENHGMGASLFLELGTPKKYYFNEWGTSTVVSLQSNKETLNIVDYGYIPSPFENYIGGGDYGLVVAPASGGINAYLYDSNQGVFFSNDPIFVKSTGGVLKNCMPGANNTFWVSHTDNPYWKISKIDSENNSIITLLDDIETCNTVERGFALGWYAILIEDEIGFLTRYEYTYETEMESFKIFSFDPTCRHTGTNDFEEFINITGKTSVSGKLYGSDMFNIKGEYYIVAGPGYFTSSECYIQIYKVDMENKTFKLVSPEVFAFNKTGTIMRENRIYFFDTKDKLNVKMVYFDTETNQFSQIYTISYPDVIRK